MTTTKRILLNARMQLGDFEGRQWPEPQLLAAANEGKNELVRLMRAVRQEYFLTSTIGTIAATTPPNASEVTLPSDFAELKVIEITDSGFEWIDFQPMDRADSRFRSALLGGGNFGGGAGIFYYDIIGNTTLALAPGSDIALGYKLHYIKTLADLTLLDSEPTGIPNEFCDYITTYVVVEALRSKDDSRIEGYLDKLAMQSVSIQQASSSRQLFHPQYVRGYLEDEEAY